MTPSHILKLLGILIVLAPCTGCCCHPKKGITLRGGLDFRECKKPSGFVELVETGWDERRRVQDLRWLENTDYAESTNSTAGSSQSNLAPTDSQPATSIPKLNQPPQLGVPPMPADLPPAPPVSTPPVPIPEPEPQLSPQLNEQFKMDLEVDEIDESASLSSDYSDEEDYQRMIELSGYERPARSITNRSTQAQPLPRQTAGARSSGWLWSKP